MDHDFSYKCLTTADSYPVSQTLQKKFNPSILVGRFGLTVTLNETHQVQLVICDDFYCNIPTKSHESLTVCNASCTKELI